MSTKILAVPYYRQVEMDSTLNTYWQNRSCGILALKMVLDFYRGQSEQEPLDLAELFEKTLANGGVNEAGDWYHAAFAKTAIGYGFRSWRRNWHNAAEDVETYRQEGVNEPSIERWNRQTMQEALPSLINSLERKHPVMVSVAKNFDEVDRPHLVVLTGIRYNGDHKPQGFYYNDPYSPSKNPRQDRYVPLSKFNDKWNYRAIFVEPAKEKQ